MEEKKYDIPVLTGTEEEKMIEFEKDGSKIKLVINTIKDNTKIISRRKESSRGIGR